MSGINAPLRSFALGCAALGCAALGCALLCACDKPKPKGEMPAPVTGEQAVPAPGEKAAPEDKGPAAAPSAPSAGPTELPNGLLVAYAQFEVEGGKVTAKPGPARLEMLWLKGGEWHTRVIEDAQSNVFHKAMVYQPPGGSPSILTFSGMEAAVKLWEPKDGKLQATTLWTEKFGGKFDRMRDGEIGDVFGDGKPAIVVGTHDQGVVAALRPDAKAKGGYAVVRLGEKKDTFVHEIEIGDIDKDKVLEVYATPSEPNTLDGGEQHGVVWRFVPKASKGPDVVADLGNRHAKEIYVGDVDGDGTDELYVAVEALTERSGATVRLVEPVEIRRYDADTPPDKGVVVATLPDRLCRFLTVGDVDGDGDKEMVAAAFRSGLWLLSPPKDKGATWEVQNIDRESSGFEHAALLADLDGDGKDELYVAADEQGELRRYTFVDGKPKRETIHKRELPGQMMTWNLMPVPVAVIESAGQAAK